MSKDPGASTRRSIVLIPSTGMNIKEAADAIGSLPGWSVKPSSYHDLTVSNGEKSIELRGVGGAVLKSVNVLPQDERNEHVPIENDQLTELAHQIEAKLSDCFTVAWVPADDDEIKTKPER